MLNPYTITYEEDHMLDRHDDRTIDALVDEIIATLKTNLAEHKEIVAEAREGYVDKAKQALEKRMAQLREGKIVSLSFSLSPPRDHSKEFETAIKMMELHKQAHEADPANVYTASAGAKPVPIPAIFELKAVDVQRFMLNDWSWMDTFLVANAAYSGKSMALAAEKGLV